MTHPLSDAAVPLYFADADPFSSEDADFAQALEDDLWNGDEGSNSEDEDNGVDGCGKDPGFEDGSDGDADDADRSDGEGERDFQRGEGKRGTLRDIDVCAADDNNNETPHIKSDSNSGDEENSRSQKKRRMEHEEGDEESQPTGSAGPSGIEIPKPAIHFGDPQFTGSLGLLPPELYHHVLKFLSAEDLSVCACVCRYLRTASSEENLWRRAYCIRWGPPPPPPPSSTRSVLDGRGGSGGMGGGGGGGEGSGGGGGGAGGGGAAGAQARSHWKRLYFERDRGEMKEFVADSPQDLRGFYAQLQAAKRNLVPRRDQVYDELVHVTSDLARAVAEWRQQNKLPERVEEAHRCSGGNCTFHRIENVFLCEKTGRAHVCDDNCAELLEDAESQMLVCAISGRCVDRMLSPQEEFDHQRAAEEAASTCQPEELQEPFMGAGRFGRAFVAGYYSSSERDLHEKQW
ncbi:unnamed protein product [Closterium sp. NIES-64]|nr:unnamed protein product [Closterium sp. NIES-64]